MPSQLCSCLVVPWRKFRGTVEGRGKRKQGLGCKLRRGATVAGEHITVCAACHGEFTAASTDLRSQSWLWQD